MVIRLLPLKRLRLVRSLPSSLAPCVGYGRSCYGVDSPVDQGATVLWSQSNWFVRYGSSKAKEQPRGSLWRSRSVISRETVQAVYELRRNKDDPQNLEKTFQQRISRLLKIDLLATLAELQRQNEIPLALKVFDAVRKEMWYKPDKFLYRQMMDALGRNRMISELERKFEELQEEGIVPDVVIYRELVGAYIRSHMLDRALTIHKKMKEIGCGDDSLSNSFIDREMSKVQRKTKSAL